MNKYVVLCAGLCAAMVFTSCKSQESAYKQRYLKAQEREAAERTQSQDVVEQNVVVPMQERAANNTRVLDNSDNVKVRQA